MMTLLAQMADVEMDDRPIRSFDSAAFLATP